MNTQSKVEASETLAPDTLQSLGDILGSATESGQIVVPIGGGSKSHWGGRVENPGLVINTKKLVGVDHAKEDQTIIVGAGKNFAELQSELSRSGQRISLDPDDLDRNATIGGIVATGQAGPLRFRFGSPRELIIGTRLALADGTVAHSGGKVIKNVAGFDMAKLIVGSFGTLGIIGEAAFRLHPLPEAEITVIVEVNHEEASDLTKAVLGSVIEPTAIEFGLGALVILIEGTSNGAKAQVGKLVSLIRQQIKETKIVEIDLKSEAKIWNKFTQERSCGGVVNARIVTRVGHLSEIHEVARKVSGKVKITVISHAGSGVHDLMISGDNPDEANPNEARETLKQFRNAIAHLGQPVTIRYAAPGYEDLVDLLGTPAPVAVSIMQKVKTSLDPDGLLAPGRFRPWW